MLPECAYYCKVATNFRINLQIINNEMTILICLICRYIMLHEFISSCKLKIFVGYLRMLSRMKAAYIFYFQNSFQEIRIISRLHSRQHSEVFEAYFRFSVGCELGEHYVPADVVY